MSIAELDRIRARLAARPRPTDLAAGAPASTGSAPTTPAAGRDRRARERRGVPAEWTGTGAADPARVILFLHGGGYMAGSLASHRHVVAQAGREAGARTLALAYRLAPEHPFPRRSRMRSPDTASSSTGGSRRSASRCRGERGRRPRPRDGAVAARGRPAAATLPLALLALGRPDALGRHPRQQGRHRPAPRPRLPGGARGRLSRRRRSAPGPRLAARRGPRRPAADADPGRLRRDPARRRPPAGGGGRSGGRAGELADLAAHDPRLAPVPPGSWRRAARPWPRRDRSSGPGSTARGRDRKHRQQAPTARRPAAPRPEALP